MKSGSAFSHLLPAAEMEEFRDKYWPLLSYASSRSTVHKLLVKDVRRIVDMASFAPLHVASIRIHRMQRRSYRPVLVPKEAFRQIDISATWSVERAENYCPSIKCLISQLADYLWIPAGCVAATVFVSSGSQGLPWHFDPAEVLIIPLVGHKDWFLKENCVVRFPFHKFVPSSALEPDPELVMHCRGQLQMPDAHDLTWEGRPGSLCFLPRGWWHRTEAKTASVSLSIGFNTPRLMDVLLERFRSILGRSEVWREPVSASALRSSGLSQALAEVVAALKLPLE